MKIKSATLLGLIGAIISIALYIFSLLQNTGAISMYIDYNVVIVIYNLCSIFSSLTLAIFFYILHKNQK